MLSILTRDILGVVSVYKLYPYPAPFRKSSLVSLGSTESKKLQQLFTNHAKLPTPHSRAYEQSICDEWQGLAGQEDYDSSSDMFAGRFYHHL